jgi:hypothetical protein
VLLLALDEFIQHMFRCILCSRWHRIGLVRHVEIMFGYLMSLVGFVHHMMRCILCPLWHGRGLLNSLR